MEKDDYEYIENTIRDLSFFIRDCRIKEEKENFKKQFSLIKNDSLPLPSQCNVVSKLNIDNKEVHISINDYKENNEMLIKVPGISINSKPRKDGRYQGYIVNKYGKSYVYGHSYEEVVTKLNHFYKFGTPKKRKRTLKKINGVPTTFNAFALYYFTNFREKKVSAVTYKIDMLRYNKYLAPTFREKLLKNIKPIDCQNILQALTNAGKGKTADEIFCLMNIIFKTAIKHDLIKRNPLDIIFHQKHEGKHGSALSKKDETLLKNSLSDKFPFIMVALYTGLRPNEYKTATINEKFIVAVNSKRKHKRIEYKKIPIIQALLPYVKNGLPDLPNLDTLRKAFKEVFPNKRLYDLRTTFYTRCVEYGVSEPALKHFVGHSPGVLAKVYTDLSDDYLLTEGKKLDKWIT